MSKHSDEKVVVIFEDDPDHAELLRNNFRKDIKLFVLSAGKDATVQDNGEVKVTEWTQEEQGIKIRTWKGTPDYYIFDLRMPGETGIEIWKRLHRPEKYVFLTIWEDDEYWRSEMKKAGISHDRVFSKRARDQQEITDKISKKMIEDNIL